ncbi:nucleoporin NDC1 isoform X2 [Hydra vulgaris]|uniref:Nucleoporin NDC1 isoform X2 n=1 Tax=Hydra vulgaris TaxID=6087 RepID=A0ABM4C654_HYDVU
MSAKEKVMLCEELANEEFYWRSFASGVWMLFVFPFSLVLFVILYNFSLYNPLQCLQDSFAMPLSISFILNFFVLQICCILFTLSHAKSIEVTSEMGIKLVFSWKKLLNTLIKLISIVVCCMTYQNLIELDTSEFVDSNHFLKICWIYLSIYYTTYFYCNEEYILVFPVVQQKKFFRLKKAIPVHIFKSFWFTLKMLKYYYLLYYVCGYMLKTILVNFFAYEKDMNLSLSSTFRGIFQISLFWNCFLISFTTIFMLGISNELVHIFNTQAYNFQIESHEKELLIGDAMESLNSLLKNLGYMDFCILSKYSGLRRSKIFELSAPGNQPHTWNRILYQCNQVLVNEQSKLKKEHEQKSHLDVVPKNVKTELFSSTDKVESLPNDKVLVSSPYKFPTFKSLTEKNVSIKKSKDNNLNIAFWCIEGLCNLIAASLKEDRYGIVQKSLPEVLSNLFSLLETCEQLTQSCNLYISNSFYQQNEVLRASQLKIAIKTGLYTITTEFGYQISGVMLPADHKKKMFEFLEFAC